MPQLKIDTTLLGTCRAASFLGVCRSTLTYWRRKGELKPTVIEEGPRGPVYKFSEADLEEFRGRIEYEA